MADQLTEALAILVEACPHVLVTRDLVTKIRVELTQGYTLDLYFRESAGQYSYTVVLGSKRVAGWDNAPHYPDLLNAPHHFHNTDGTVQAARLAGNPPQDILIVAAWINEHLARQLPDNPEKPD